MYNSNSKIKLAAAGVTVLLFISLFTAGYFFTGNKSITKELNNEKLKTESLLSQKLQLEKEMEKFRKDIAALNGQNTDLDRLLKQTTQTLDQKEKQIKRLSDDNMGLVKFRKEVVELRKLKAQFENQLMAMNADLSKLRQENDLLKNENSDAKNRIAGLQNENKTLKSNLDLVSSMANNSLSEAVKKNNKMTVSARRARKIQLAFDLPQKSLSGLEFKVTSPNDKIFSSGDGSISHKLLINDGNPVASLDPQTGYYELTQRVLMEYAPKSRMEKGIYKVDVYNQGTLISRMLVKLK